MAADKQIVELVPVADILAEFRTEPVVESDKSVEVGKSAADIADTDKQRFAADKWVRIEEVAVEPVVAW